MLCDHGGSHRDPVRSCIILLSVLCVSRLYFSSFLLHVPIQNINNKENMGDKHSPEATVCATCLLAYHSHVDFWIFLQENVSKLLILQ